MTKTAIVSCRIFEDELTHLMKGEIEKKIKIILIETDFSETIEKKFAQEKIDYLKIKSEELDEILLGFEKNDENTIVIHLIEFSMEARPAEVKKAVYTRIEQLREKVEGILVFYGLCGNVLGDVELDLSQPNCPVRILRDDEGNIGDDCICISLGSRKRYMQVLNSVARGEGTYFLTPMQAAHWREIAYASALTPDPNDDDMLRMVFEYSNYKNVGKVPTGLNYESQFDDIVDDFSKRFDLKIIEYEGATSIVETSYLKFMNEIEKRK